MLAKIDQFHANTRNREEIKEGEEGEEEEELKKIVKGKEERKENWSQLFAVGRRKSKF